MGALEAVLFDADGVLVDSLDAHLRICRDKAAEFGLDLHVPAPAELRRMLKRGVVISPMVRFFEAVGMPADLAQRADEDYRREFKQRYPLGPFPGVGEMLARLAAAPLRLGIVTSNTLENVSAALGELFAAFEPGLVFDRDHRTSPTKAAALRAAAAALGAPLERILYVGDQQADLDAATATGARFLGVSYGWGFDENEPGIPTASTPAAVADHVLANAS